MRGWDGRLRSVVLHGPDSDGLKSERSFIAGQGFFFLRGFKKDLLLRFVSTFEGGKDISWFAK